MSQRASERANDFGSHNATPASSLSSAGLARSLLRGGRIERNLNKNTVSAGPRDPPGEGKIKLGVRLPILVRGGGQVASAAGETVRCSPRREYAGRVIARFSNTRY